MGSLTRVLQAATARLVLLLHVGGLYSAGPLRHRRALSAGCRPDTPVTLNYKEMEGSMYNTPPCWSIYVCGLVFKHLLGAGGLPAVKANNDAKVGCCPGLTESWCCPCAAAQRLVFKT